MIKADIDKINESFIEIYKQLKKFKLDTKDIEKLRELELEIKTKILENQLKEMNIKL